MTKPEAEAEVLLIRLHGKQHPMSGILIKDVKQDCRAASEIVLEALLAVRLPFAMSNRSELEEEQIRKIAKRCLAKLQGYIAEISQTYDIPVQISLGSTARNNLLSVVDNCWSNNGNGHSTQSSPEVLVETPERDEAYSMFTS